MDKLKRGILIRTIVKVFGQIDYNVILHLCMFMPYIYVYDPFF